MVSQMTTKSGDTMSDWADIFFLISKLNRQPDTFIDDLFRYIGNQDLYSISIGGEYSYLDFDPIDLGLDSRDEKGLNLPLEKKLAKIHHHAKRIFSESNERVYLAPCIRPTQGSDSCLGPDLHLTHNNWDDRFFEFSMWEDSHVYFEKHLDHYLNQVRQFYAAFRPSIGYYLRENRHDKEDVPSCDDIANGTLRMLYPITVLSLPLVESVGRDMLLNAGFPLLEEFDDGGMLLMPYNNPSDWDGWPIPLERVINGKWKPPE